MIKAMFAKINEATLSLFCELGIRQKTNFAYYKIILIHCGSIKKKKRKANEIFSKIVHGSARFVHLS